MNRSNYIYQHLCIITLDQPCSPPMYHADDASGRDKVASIQMVVSQLSVVVRKTTLFQSSNPLFGNLSMSPLCRHTELRALISLCMRETTHGAQHNAVAKSVLSNIPVGAPPPRWSCGCKNRGGIPSGNISYSATNFPWLCSTRSENTRLARYSGVFADAPRNAQAVLEKVQRVQSAPNKPSTTLQLHKVSRRRLRRCTRAWIFQQNRNVLVTFALRGSRVISSSSPESSSGALLLLLLLLVRTR